MQTYMTLDSITKGKIDNVALMFVGKTKQDLPCGFTIDLILKLADYHVNECRLDLDAMLQTEDSFSFIHDIVSIWNDDKMFLPRFALRDYSPSHQREYNPDNYRGI
jgi:hypothetical protein